MSKNKTVKGFTLIEILVVVALIAILTAITFIAINPNKIFMDARNTTRRADISEILSAITQYTSKQGNSLGDFTVVDASLAIPTCTADPADMAEIGPAADPALYVDLTTILVGVEDFIVGIPFDPSLTAATAASGGYGYTICQTSTGRVQINAPLAEPSGTEISVKR